MLRNETIEKYSLYLLELAQDVAAIDMKADISVQAKKLREQAVYLIYLMNQEDKE